MRLNDNNTFIGINPPYQLSVIHSSKLIYPREIYQRGVERKRVELIARDFNEYIVNEPKVSFRNGRYAPKMPEEAWHPLFVEALQKQSHVEYLLDVLLSPDMEERAVLIVDYPSQASS